MKILATVIVLGRVKTRVDASAMAMMAPSAANIKESSNNIKFL